MEGAQKTGTVGLDQCGRGYVRTCESVLTSWLLSCTEFRNPKASFWHLFFPEKDNYSSVGPGNSICEGRGLVVNIGHPF